MNKSLLVFNIFLFLSSYCLGQKTITKQEFDKLVDYSTIKYVQTFIEKNDVSKPYYQDYINKVKPKFDSVNLANFNTILSFEEIKNLLNKNNSALNLAQKINENKKNYDNFQDDKLLLQSLKAERWDKVNLTQTAAQIQQDVSLFLQNMTPKKLQSEFDTLKSQFDKLKIDTKNNIESLNSLKNFFFVGMGTLLLLLLLFVGLLFWLSSKERIIKHVLISKRVNDKFGSKKVISGSNQSSSNPNPSAAFTNEQIEKIKEVISKQISDMKTDKKEIETSSYRYLKGQRGKIFSIVDYSGENSFFRIFTEKQDEANFEFYGNEAEAIANRVFSEDVCEIIEGTYQNAHRVKTIKPGTVKRINDRWEVIERVKIKLY